MTPHPRDTNEHGQTMAEYALVLGVISLGVIAALGLFTTTVSDAISAAARLIP